MPLNLSKQKPTSEAFNVSAPSASIDRTDLSLGIPSPFVVADDYYYIHGLVHLLFFSLPVEFFSQYQSAQNSESHTQANAERPMRNEPAVPLPKSTSIHTVPELLVVTRILRCVCILLKLSPLCQLHFVRSWGFERLKLLMIEFNFNALMMDAETRAISHQLTAINNPTPNNTQRTENESTTVPIGFTSPQSAPVQTCTSLSSAISESTPNTMTPLSPPSILLNLPGPNSQPLTEVPLRETLYTAVTQASVYFLQELHLVLITALKNSSLMRSEFRNRVGFEQWSQAIQATKVLGGPIPGPRTGNTHSRSNSTGHAGHLFTRAGSVGGFTAVVHDLIATWCLWLALEYTPEETEKSSYIELDIAAEVQVSSSCPNFTLPTELALPDPSAVFHPAAMASCIRLMPRCTPAFCMKLLGALKSLSLYSTVNCMALGSVNLVSTIVCAFRSVLLARELTSQRVLVLELLRVIAPFTSSSAAVHSLFNLLESPTNVGWPHAVMSVLLQLSAAGPSLSYILFDGSPGSSLQVASISGEHWPPSQGYTASLWFYIDAASNVQFTGNSVLHLLTVISNDQKSLLELHLNAMTGVVTLRTAHKTSTDFPPCRFQPSRWYHIAVTHYKGIIQSSVASLYIDGQLVVNSKLSYLNRPGGSNNGIKAYVGAPRLSHNSSSSSDVSWRLASCCLLEDHMYDTAVQALYEGGLRAAGSVFGGARLHTFDLLHGLYQSTKASSHSLDAIANGCAKPVRCSIVGQQGKVDADAQAAAANAIRLGVHVEKSLDDDNYLLPPDGESMVELTSIPLSAILPYDKLFFYFHASNSFDGEGQFVSFGASDSTTRAALVFNSGPTQYASDAQLAGTARVIRSTLLSDAIRKVGGLRRVFWLMAKATSRAALGQCVLLLVVALRRNPKNCREMKELGGYTLLSHILKNAQSSRSGVSNASNLSAPGQLRRSRTRSLAPDSNPLSLGSDSLIDAHIVDLIFALIGLNDRCMLGSIKNLEALETLLYDYRIWVNCSIEVQEHLFQCLINAIIANADRAKNIEKLRETRVVPWLLSLVAPQHRLLIIEPSLVQHVISVLRVLLMYDLVELELQSVVCFILALGPNSTVAAPTGDCQGGSVSVVNSSLFGESAKKRSDSGAHTIQSPNSATSVGSLSSQTSSSTIRTMTSSGQSARARANVVLISKQFIEMLLDVLLKIKSNYKHLSVFLKFVDFNFLLAIIHDTEPQFEFTGPHSLRKRGNSSGESAPSRGAGACMSPSGILTSVEEDSAVTFAVKILLTMFEDREQVVKFRIANGFQQLGSLLLVHAHSTNLYTILLCMLMGKQVVDITTLKHDYNRDSWIQMVQSDQIIAVPDILPVLMQLVAEGLELSKRQQTALDLLTAGNAVYDSNAGLVSIISSKSIINRVTEPCPGFWTPPSNACAADGSPLISFEHSKIAATGSSPSSSTSSFTARARASFSRLSRGSVFSTKTLKPDQFAALAHAASQSSTSSPVLSSVSLEESKARRRGTSGNTLSVPPPTSPLVAVTDAEDTFPSESEPSMHSAADHNQRRHMRAVSQPFTQTQADAIATASTESYSSDLPNILGSTTEMKRSTTLPANNPLNNLNSASPISAAAAFRLRPLPSMSTFNSLLSFLMRLYNAQEEFRKACTHPVMLRMIGQAIYASSTLSANREVLSPLYPTSPLSWQENNLGPVTINSLISPVSGSSLGLKSPDSGLRALNSSGSISTQPIQGDNNPLSPVNIIPPVSSSQLETDQDSSHIVMLPDLDIHSAHQLSSERLSANTTDQLVSPTDPLGLNRKPNNGTGFSSMPNTRSGSGGNSPARDSFADRPTHQRSGSGGSISAASSASFTLPALFEHPISVLLFRFYRQIIIHNLMTSSKGCSLLESVLDHAIIQPDPSTQPTVCTAEPLYPSTPTAPYSVSYERIGYQTVILSMLAMRFREKLDGRVLLENVKLMSNFERICSIWLERSYLGLFGEGSGMVILQLLVGLLHTSELNELLTSETLKDSNSKLQRRTSSSAGRVLKPMVETSQLLVMQQYSQYQNKQFSLNELLQLNRYLSEQGRVVFTEITEDAALITVLTYCLIKQINQTYSPELRISATKILAHLIRTRVTQFSEMLRVDMSKLKAVTGIILPAGRLAKAKSPDFFDCFDSGFDRLLVKDDAFPEFFTWLEADQASFEILLNHKLSAEYEAYNSHLLTQKITIWAQNRARYTAELASTMKRLNDDSDHVQHLTKNLLTRCAPIKTLGAQKIIRRHQNALEIEKIAAQKWQTLQQEAYRMIMMYSAWDYSKPSKSYTSRFNNVLQLYHSEELHSKEIHSEQLLDSKQFSLRQRWRYDATEGPSRIRRRLIRPSLMHPEQNIFQYPYKTWEDKVNHPHHNTENAQVRHSRNVSSSFLYQSPVRSEPERTLDEPIAAGVSLPVAASPPTLSVSSIDSSGKKQDDQPKSSLSANAEAELQTAVAEARGQLNLLIPVKVLTESTEVDTERAKLSSTLIEALAEKESGDVFESDTTDQAAPKSAGPRKLSLKVPRSLAVLASPKPSPSVSSERVSAAQTEPKLRRRSKQSFLSTPNSSAQSPRSSALLGFEAMIPEVSLPISVFSSEQPSLNLMLRSPMMTSPAKDDRTISSTIESISTVSSSVARTLVALDTTNPTQPAMQIILPSDTPRQIVECDPAAEEDNMDGVDELDIDEEDESWYLEEERLKLLLNGETIRFHFNCLRVDGMDEIFGILLLCSNSIFILDNYQISPEGDIVRLQQSQIEGSAVETSSATRSTSRGGESEADSPSSRRWLYNEVQHVHKRRYLLRPAALELFFQDGSNHLLVLNVNQRDAIYGSLVNLCPSVRMQEHNRIGIGLTNLFVSDAENQQKVALQILTQAWCNGECSNFEYLIQLNSLAGRTYNDLTQYPVMPWILKDYDSNELDLNNHSIFRDLSKPMGALTEERADHFRQRYKESGESTQVPAFNYGTHYSSAAVVLYYLIRAEPFTQHAIRFQSGRFDRPDRLFHSIKQSWLSASSQSMNDVKELIPEFFFFGDFLKNGNGLYLGRRQDNILMNDVLLPRWANQSTREFIRLHRQALESDYVSAHLHYWIDLIFGVKQTGESAVQALNVFYYLTYAGQVDVDKIDDPIVRRATIEQIRSFGQTPQQLFQRAHPPKQVKCATGMLFSKSNYAMQNDVLNFDHAIGQIYNDGVGSERLIVVRPGQLIVPPSTTSPLHYTGPRVQQLRSRTKPMKFGIVAWAYPDGSLRSGALEFTGSITSNPVVGAAGLNASGIATTISRFTRQYLNMHDGLIRVAAYPEVDVGVFATGGEEGNVCVWHQAEASAASSDSISDAGPDIRLASTLYGHRAPVTCLAISKAFSFIVSGSLDGTVIQWDLNRLHVMRQIRVVPAQSSIACVAVNHSTGDIVVASRNPCFLAVIDVNGKLLARYPDLKEEQVNLKHHTQHRGASFDANSESSVCTPDTKDWPVLDDIISLTTADTSGYQMKNSAALIITGHSSGIIRVWHLVFNQTSANLCNRTAKPSSAASPPTSPTNSHPREPTASASIVLDCFDHGISRPQRVATDQQRVLHVTNSATNSSPKLAAIKTSTSLDSLKQIAAASPVNPFNSIPDQKRVVGSNTLRLKHMINTRDLAANMAYRRRIGATLKSDANNIVTEGGEQTEIENADGSSADHSPSLLNFTTEEPEADEFQSVSTTVTIDRVGEDGEHANDIIINSSVLVSRGSDLEAQHHKTFGEIHIDDEYTMEQTPATQQPSIAALLQQRRLSVGSRRGHGESLNGCPSTTSEASTAKRWNLIVVSEFSGHNAPVTSLHLSLDMNSFWSGDCSGVVSHWLVPDDNLNLNFQTDLCLCKQAQQMRNTTMKAFAVAVGSSNRLSARGVACPVAGCSKQICDYDRLDHFRTAHSDVSNRNKGSKPITPTQLNRSHAARDLRF